MGHKVGLSRGKGRAKTGSKKRHKRWLNKKR
jgi:hypothetical protein